MEVPMAKIKTLPVWLSLFMLLLVAAFGGGQEANAQEQQQGGAGGEVFGDFNVFDANNNDELIQQEFNQGLFEIWDTDNSGTINENEFNTGANAWFENTNVNFNVFDANNNGELTQQEFNQGASDAGLFGAWDADNNNVIDQNEFNQVASQVQTAQGGTTMMTAAGTGATGQLTETGGPAILLPAAALLLGAGILTYAIVHRR